MYQYLLLACFVGLLVSGNYRRGKMNVYTTLLRQSARYATAAQQDASPLVAVLHANYAAAYFYALKDIASEGEIHNATGVDVKKFREHITGVQDQVTRRVNEACPAFAGQVDLYLSTIAGET